MAIFKDHNISVKQLLGFIPQALITNLSLTTKIDYYAKVLHGNKLFYLLLYGILDNDRLSQRTLEDTFNDSVSGKKAVKYSIAFDGVLPSYSKVFTNPTYGSEDIALPEAVMEHVKKEIGHQNIYVLDRGLQATRTMLAFSTNEVTFICRAKENRKFVELASLITEGQDTDLGESKLIRDCRVRLYTGTPVNNKQGNIHYRHELTDGHFRLIVVESKTEEGKEYWFLTNDFKHSAKEIAQAYRRRWDIEVFFRFLKQELNVSHLVSLNTNAIQVILYMTLTVAMMVLMYKKANKIGYKTAKRRFAMEVRDLAIALIVVQCGGDPGLFFKT
jgi:transposase